MRKVPPIRALQSFEAAARRLSIAEAADELCVTPSAVSHQIKSLETYLGVQLFHRTNRQIRLTEAGRTYLASVERALDRIDIATQNMLDGGGSELLTVHCPPSFAPAWLMPRIPDFLKRYPGIGLRLHATPDSAAFFSSETDVEIRYGNGDWPGLVSVKLLTERIAPMVAPAVRARFENGADLDALMSLNLIHSERSPVSWADWFKAQGASVSLAGSALWFDRGYLSIEAAARGLGVALESLVFADRELTTGAVVPLFDEPRFQVESGAHYLVYPEIYGSIPKVAAFHSWLNDEVAQATVNPTAHGNPGAGSDNRKH